MERITFDRLNQTFVQNRLPEAVQPRIQAILSHIQQASCQSCTWRRLLPELEGLLRSCGFLLAEYSPDMGSNEDIACILCVQKHLNQAFVLQGEYFCGYTGYFGRIVAHLEESIRECPKNAEILAKMLQYCLKKTLIEQKPYIPREVLAELVKNAQNIGISEQTGPLLLKKEENMSKDTGQRAETVSPLTLDIDFAQKDIIKASRDTLSEALHLLDQASTHLSDPPEWSGYMACAAEVLALESPYTANYLRNRRLMFEHNPEDFKESGQPYVDNHDIRDAILRKLT